MGVRSVHWRWFVLACAVIALGGPLWATTPTDETAALTRQLMSPFCPGLLLADCQSSAAAELRAEIRDRLEAGESRVEVVDDLVLRFGPGVRGQPEPRGFAVLLWIVPLGLGAAALVGLAWRLRASSSPTGGAAASGASPIDDPLITARIDDELCAMD